MKTEIKLFYDTQKWKKKYIKSIWLIVGTFWWWLKRIYTILIEFIELRDMSSCWHSNNQQNSDATTVYWFPIIFGLLEKALFDLNMTALMVNVATISFRYKSVLFSYFLISMNLDTDCIVRQIIQKIDVLFSRSVVLFCGKTRSISTIWRAL